MLVVGIVLLVAGLVAGIGLWVAAAGRLDDAVRDLARAPADCDTTLDFSQTGEFLLFVETRGELDEVRGDCDASGAYDFSGDDLPSVALTLTDPDGGDVDLPNRTDVDYDAAGYVGRSVSRVDITTTGDHVLRVESGDQGFAVAVGKDPNAGVTGLRVGGVLAALVGLVGGVICIVLGARRPTPSGTTPAAWPGTPAWPSAPAGSAPPGTVPPGSAPPSWPGATSPPVGPPQGWVDHPPTAPRPEPSAGGPPGGWGPAPGAPEPAAPWPPRPGAPAGPSGQPGPDDRAVPPRPPDGSTGDGQRSPWAPPQGDDERS